MQKVENLAYMLKIQVLGIKFGISDDGVVLIYKIKY